jgi:hypothetical protein
MSRGALPDKQQALACDTVGIVIDRADLLKLREVVNQARVILNTTALPDGRLVFARELMETALTMADDLIARPPLSAMRSGRRKLKAIHPWQNDKT